MACLSAIIDRDEERNTLQPCFLKVYGRPRRAASASGLLTMAALMLVLRPSSACTASPAAYTFNVDIAIFLSQITLKRYRVCQIRSDTPPAELSCPAGLPICCSCFLVSQESSHSTPHVTEESGWALGVLSGTLPEAHEGINRRGTPIVTRVRCVFGHTATPHLVSLAENLHLPILPEEFYGAPVAVYDEFCRSHLGILLQHASMTRFCYFDASIWTRCI